jgi:hypothetical protein
MQNAATLFMNVVEKELCELRRDGVLGRAIK